MFNKNNGFSKIVVTCPREIPTWLKKELNILGWKITKEGKNFVETDGTLRDAAQLNLLTRTGHKVLYLIAEFACINPDELYKNIKNMKWGNFFNKITRFSVSSSVENEFILDNRFANLKCKDAIADHFLEKYGIRPDSGSENDSVVIFLHWKNNIASVYLDTSGETLASHGYRVKTHEAPMQETLATAILYAGKWDKNSTFINPMCGSGTIAIEAALLASNTLVSFQRDNYAFMHYKNFNMTEFENMKSELLGKKLSTLPFRIIATDIDPVAIKSSRINAKKAGVEDLIEFEVCDFKDTPIPEGGGVIVFNPEYGERMGSDKDLTLVYKEIGDFMKQKCKGYTGYIFTGGYEEAKSIGLKTSRKIPFLSGKIECRLLEYELY